MNSIIKFKFTLIFILISNLFIGNIRGQSDTLSILLIGNSLTGYNDLPVLLENLANDTNQDILVESYIRYGKSLHEISSHNALITKINSRPWTHVVLQDSPYKIAYLNSYNDIIPSADPNPLLPTLKRLRNIVIENNNKTKVIYFMPWAYKDGMLWISGQTDDFFDMQEKIMTNSILCADSLNLQIAPIGWAWYTVLKDRNLAEYYNIELFDPDLSHPSLTGSYLSACVLYVTIFNKELKSNFYSSLVYLIAEYLQTTASSVVLESTEKWNWLTSLKKENQNNFKLYQNYPNPFNAQTIISFNLKKNNFISLVIYNSLGQEIETLISKEMKKGIYSIEFDAGQYSSGIYYYKIENGNYTEVKSMILIK